MSWSRPRALLRRACRLADLQLLEGMAEGPTAGLAVVTPLLNDKTLQRYPWLWAVHGDLLERLGRHAEARSAFERAASLAGNDQDRHTLLRRVSNASRD